MRTVVLLRELLADITWRRLVLFAVLVLVPAATWLPAALAPRLGAAGGLGSALALLALSALGAALLLLAASLPVAGAIIRLQGLWWRKLPERTLAAALGGAAGLAGAVLLLAPALVVAYGLLPWLGWACVALSVVGCGYLMLFAAAAADVGPSRAPMAVWNLLRRDGLRVSLALGLVALALFLAVAGLFRVGLQYGLAVWLVASLACLAPTAAALVWQAGRAPAYRRSGSGGRDVLATLGQDLAQWLTADAAGEEEALPQMRSSAAAISSGRPFGSGRV